MFFLLRQSAERTTHFYGRKSVDKSHRGHIIHEEGVAPPEGLFLRLAGFVVFNGF